jgi:hypothetical protein
MSWFSADYRCLKPACAQEFDLVVLREERDAQNCPTCGSPALRVPSAPNTTRASFLDGTKRFDKLRQQDRVERAISESVAKGDRTEATKLSKELTRVAEKKT